jgi:DNA-damage-inducible protein D
MHKPFKKTVEELEFFVEPDEEPAGMHYASEVMDSLGFNDETELDHSVERALRACISLGFPVRKNFRKVFRSDGKVITHDWKLSGLACYLLAVNSDPANPNVAKAQVYFFIKK